MIKRAKPLAYIINKEYFDNLDKIIIKYIKQSELEELRSQQISKYLFRFRTAQSPYIDEKITVHENGYIAYKECERNSSSIDDFKIKKFLKSETAYNVKTISKSVGVEYVCNQLLKYIMKTDDNNIISFHKDRNIDSWIEDLIVRKIANLRKCHILCQDRKQNFSELEKSATFIELKWMKNEDAILCTGDIGEIKMDENNFIACLSLQKNILAFRSPKSNYVL